MNENDAPPLPAVPTPEEQTASRLARIEHWIARVAHTLANHSAQFDQHSANVREEVAQLHGGLLLVDGTTARIERLLTSVEAGGESFRSIDQFGEPARLRRHTPTDQFELPAGVSISIPKHTVLTALTTWKGVKVLYYTALALLAVSGWARWLLHVIQEGAHRH